MTCAGVYAALLFFNHIFQSCMFYPYNVFLKSTGLRIQFFCIKWHTTAFNRTILRLGNSGSVHIRSWLIKGFNVGVLITLVLLPVGTILLFVTIFNDLDSNKDNDSIRNNVVDNTLDVIGGYTKKVKVGILLPGLNLPLNEIMYYIIALLFSTVLHELGHAVAAVMEDVPVTGFGLYLYFCLPVAFTEISLEHLNNLKSLRKLRILCAGIWTNVIFAGLSYLLLSSLGVLVVPWYTVNKYVIITDILKSSPLHSDDYKGLKVGNIITKINDCPVKNDDTWLQCLLNPIKKRPGYCVSSDFIRFNDESIEIAHHSSDGLLQCCDERNVKMNCFEYIDDFSNDEPLEIPQHVCLDVRRTLEDSYGYCSESGKCEKGFCLKPLLHNTTTILSFQRTMVNEESLRDVIYRGHPYQVWHTVRVSPFIPKYKFISPQWGDMIVLLLKYLIIFSQGLALVNAIPFYGFDGHHITNTIVHSFLANRIPERPKRDMIATVVSGMGTLLFILFIIKVFWLSLTEYFL